MHARGKQKHGTEVTHKATHYKKYLRIVYKIMKESIKSSSRYIVRIGKDEFHAQQNIMLPVQKPNS